MELANGFSELTDAALQRARLRADMDHKERLYGVRWPIDEGLPGRAGAWASACAGVALGFDRLVMLANGAERIEDVLWLPVREQTCHPERKRRIDAVAPNILLCVRMTGQRGSR